MVEDIKKSTIGLKYTDMANMFNAYSTDDGDFFYSGRTIEFGNISQLNEKFVIKHLWMEGDSWYKLANTYYNEPRLWWIICLANQVTNPLDSVADETVINIPKNNIVQVVLDRIVE